MSKTQTSKNTNSKDEVMAYFQKNAVQKSRSKGSDDGGRYNPNLRTLTLPSKFGGKAVRFAHESGTNLALVQIADDGNFRCHPTQHFIKVPEGTFQIEKAVTFKRVYRLSVTASLDEDGDTVAYEIPLPSKSGK